MNDYFHIVNKCLGWGDPPIEGIFFIGLEEASSWDDSGADKIKIERLKQCLDQGLYGEPIDDGVLKKNREHFTKKSKEEQSRKRFSDVPRIMSKVILESGFDQGFKSTAKAEDYWFNKLFQKGSRVFQANLYPLGKPRLKDELFENTLTLFDINSAQYSALIHDNIERFNRIRQFREHCKPAVTICFGKAGWTDFRGVFGLEAISSSTDNSFEVHKNERIILAPFFWNKDMGNDNVRKLANQIKSEFFQ